MSRIATLICLLVSICFLIGSNTFSFASACASQTKPSDCSENDWNVAIALFKAVKTYDHQSVKLLADSGADLSAVDESGWTALMWGALLGRTSVVKPLLENGSDVNYATQDNVTSVLIAATQGNGAVVKLLLGYGADPNAADSKGLTPLQSSILNKHPKTSKILAEGGAYLNSNFLDGSPLFSTDRPKPDLSKVKLSDASIAGDVDVAKLKLRSIKDINAIEIGNFNPLMYAALSGKLEIVQLLLRNGADVNVVHGIYTPLIAAVHGRNSTVVKLIYDRSNPIIREWKPAKFAASARDIANAYAQREGRADLLKVFK